VKRSRVVVERENMTGSEELRTFGVYVLGQEWFHHKVTFDQVDAALALARVWLLRGRDVEIDCVVMSRAELSAHPDADPRVVLGEDEPPDDATVEEWPTNRRGELVFDDE